MVAFPDSIVELTSRVEDFPVPHHQNNRTDPSSDEFETARHEPSETKALEIVVLPSKDHYTLFQFDEMPKHTETSKLEMSAGNLTAKHAIVKKVAAALKNLDSLNSDKSDGKSTMGRSLSSGDSIVTLSSLATDPDPEFPNGGKNPMKKKLVTDERWYNTTMQVAIPFFIAGIGTIGAGLILNAVTDWPVFKDISQLVILIPSLLGLKGNLDMCLASRLSTQANLGNMTSYREIGKMILGNIALVQVQAIVAGTLVAFFAIIVSASMNGKYASDHSLLIIAASISTATISCFILDFAIVAIIMVSHHSKLQPDNIATPIAASIGDVCVMAVISTIASSLYAIIHVTWILYAIICCYLVLLPIWIFIVLRNKYTKNILTSGWVPVLSALVISGVGGIILDRVVDELKGFVIFQPIINGIGGNLVSVQASRISTMLHQTSIMGILPPHAQMWISPFKALFKGATTAKSARILIGMAIPGHLIFVTAADFIAQGRSTVSAIFVLSYLFVALLQILLLLYVAHLIIHGMWKMNCDPDNASIPYLTALGDLSGTMFLALAFIVLGKFHLEYEKA